MKRSFSRNWVVNTLRPGLDNDGFASVKLTGADSTTDWNIAPMVCGDAGLKNALYAINVHYKQDSPDNAKTCGLPIFDSEDIVAYRHKFSSALDMAYKIIRSYASGRMVQYVMHPIIEAIYDNVPYTYKGILAAAHPWSGYYKIEPSLWVVAQFTQFIAPGWHYIDSGCSGGKNILTLKTLRQRLQYHSPQRSPPQTFDLVLNNFNADTLHMADNGRSHHQLPDLLFLYTIMLFHQIRSARQRQPVRPRGGLHIRYRMKPHSPFRMLKTFESYQVGKQPKYTVDQSCAFEVALGGKHGGSVSDN